MSMIYFFLLANFPPRFTPSSDECSLLKHTPEYELKSKVALSPSHQPIPMKKSRYQSLLPHLSWPHLSLSLHPTLSPLVLSHSAQPPSFPFDQTSLKILLDTALYVTYSLLEGHPNPTPSFCTVINNIFLHSNIIHRSIFKGNFSHGVIARLLFEPTSKEYHQLLSCMTTVCSLFHRRSLAGTEVTYSGTMMASTHKLNVSDTYRWIHELTKCFYNSMSNSNGWILNNCKDSIAFWVLILVLVDKWYVSHDIYFSFLLMASLSVEWIDDGPGMPQQDVFHSLSSGCLCSIVLDAQ